jgi:hypothetical protein
MIEWESGERKNKKRGELTALALILITKHAQGARTTAWNVLQTLPV